VTGEPGRSRFHLLTVADIRHETADAVSIAFAVPPELRERFHFMPGQYLTLRIVLEGEELRRSYSICSGLDEDEIRIAVKRIAGGVFSGFARTRLRRGDAIEVMSPQGHFTTPLRPEAARLFVGVAAGSGITPILSILKSVLTREPASSFVLLYGNRTSRDILFAEALAALKDRYLGRLSVTHLLSREAQDIPLLHGRLDRDHIVRLLRATIPEARLIDQAFLCGPAAMMTEAAETLAALGLAPKHIHVEHFTAGIGGRARPSSAEEQQPERPATDVEIILDGRRHRIQVPNEVSIIDAARDAGLDLPYSCRGGMCCTCRARLVEGAADMAVNYSLQPWEIAAGFILTCQARPITPSLTLDFDQV